MIRWRHEILKLCLGWGGFVQGSIGLCDIYGDSSLCTVFTNEDYEEIRDFEDVEGRNIADLATWVVDNFEKFDELFEYYKKVNY